MALAAGIIIVIIILVVVARYHHTFIAMNDECRIQNVLYDVLGRGTFFPLPHIDKH